MTADSRRRPSSFSAGLVTGLWIPVLSGVALYLMGLRPHWVGVAMLVEVAAALGVIAAAPPWRRLASGVLVGILAWPAFGIIWLAVTAVAMG